MPSQIEIRDFFAEVSGVLVELFKILIPAIVAVKILEVTGIVAIISQLLEPVMGLFGLPGEMALVITTGLFTNLYAAISVLVMLIGAEPLTVAQSSTLATMLLIAHALPVELALTHKVGAHYLFAGLLRVASSMIAGLTLHTLYSNFQQQQHASTITWVGGSTDGGLFSWALSQVYSLGFTALVLTLLLLVMRGLNATGCIDLLGRKIKPLLSLIGISDKAATITVFGLLAGITFGSGLLVAEARKNTLSERDTVLALAFLSLCHGIIEDTILMMLIGADLFSIVGFRVLFTLLVVTTLGSSEALIQRSSSKRILPAS